MTRLATFSAALFLIAGFAFGISTADAALIQNGVVLNGIALNDVSLNGVALNGLSANGVTAKGFFAIGFSTNNSNPNMLTQNGIPAPVGESMAVLGVTLPDGEFLAVPAK
jgi:hypothetical protein